MKLHVSGSRGHEKPNKVLLTDAQASLPYNNFNQSLICSSGKGFHKTLLMGSDLFCL